MSTVIKPTIGRVVLVHRGISNQPEPALISYVWHDRMINVGGFDHNGKPFAITSLQLLQDDDVATGTCYAEWMPYQKGQAAKTEALEAKLDAVTSEAPITTDQQIEQEIKAKGLTAPRITPDDIEANIVDVEFVKHVSKSGQVLRWAVLTTRNGFAVVGKPSCAVSSANDNIEIGEKVALSNSKEEIWPLMGYALRSKLAQGGAA